MDNRVRRRRWLWSFVALLLLAAVWWARGMLMDPRWDESPQRETTTSRDLEHDLAAMWRTVPNPGESWEVAPVSAINAANRVFATVDLRGKSREQAEKVLHYDPRPQYGYHRPFWPVNKGTWVLRFDCGNFGWQFDVTFDEKGQVKGVERRWIH